MLSFFIDNINFNFELFSTQMEQRKVRKRQMGDLLRWHILTPGRGLHFWQNLDLRVEHETFLSERRISGRRVTALATLSYRVSDSLAR